MTFEGVPTGPVIRSERPQSCRRWLLPQAATSPAFTLQLLPTPLSGMLLDRTPRHHSDVESQTHAADTEHGPELRALLADMKSAKQRFMTR